MSRVEAAAAMDRLPWLPDEPPPRRIRRRGAALFAPLMAIVLLVAGAAYWLGSGGVENLAPPTSAPPRPAATVRLPAAHRAAPAQPQVKLAPAPEVEPIVVPPMPVIDTPPPIRRSPEKTRAMPHRAAERAPSPGSASEPGQAAPRVATDLLQSQALVRPTPAFVARPWNPRVAQGAAGRLVQVGAFGSIHQAKLGWVFMVGAYPAMSRLPAVVRPARNSNGRIFYRFQVGTTSQAHSEVLCQRMQRISFSCAVVDLPWKAKVER
jgi:hypothetical protein